ncbi:endonuclease, partial [Vibrio parahaemolyticus]
CRGKANIPTFIKIFDQFGANAVAIHDLDTKLNSNGKKNAMWTINEKIRLAADATNGRVQTLVHVPDFEGDYLDESPQKDKPYNLFKHITASDFESNPRYDRLRSSLMDIESGCHTGLYTQIAELEAKI